MNDNQCNIFKDAKFGELFQTLDNRPAVLVGWSQYMDKAILYIKERDIEDYGLHQYNLDGTEESGNHNLDIIYKL